MISEVQPVCLVLSNHRQSRRAPFGSHERIPPRVGCGHSAAPAAVFPTVGSDQKILLLTSAAPPSQCGKRAAPSSDESIIVSRLVYENAQTTDGTSFAVRFVG